MASGPPSASPRTPMTRAEFSLYVQTEYARIARFVRSRVGRADDAEDLVQKTLLRLFQTCDTISADRPAGFVFTALRHAITDYWRAQGRRRPSELPDQLSGLESSSIYPGDAGSLEQRCRDALRSALNALTTRERQAFALYWNTVGDRAEALLRLGLADKDKNARFKGYDGPLHHARTKVGLTLAPHWEALRGLSYHRIGELVAEALAGPTPGSTA